MSATPPDPAIPADEPTALCACARPGDGTHAVAVDPALKAAALTRLRRIEGQVRGLQRMLEDERYCADVLTQVSSVHEALRGVARILFRNHLEHCAAAAIRSDDPEQSGAMYDELVELLYRNAR
jgi:DNA-binding FrmR family transcriptional regulator